MGTVKEMGQGKMSVKQLLAMPKKELILVIERLEKENQDLIHLLAWANELLVAKNDMSEVFDWLHDLKGDIEHIDNYEEFDDDRSYLTGWLEAIEERLEGKTNA